MKKQILITALLLAIPVLSFARDDEEVRPSITRNADKAEYIGNVNVGISFVGTYINTTHGVIFPRCNIYTGGSAEYSFLWGMNLINVHGAVMTAAAPGHPVSVFPLVSF